MKYILCCFLSLSFLLSSCAVTHHQDDGFVMAEKSIYGKDARAYNMTKVGAMSGLTAGLATGGLIGSFIGALSSGPGGWVLGGFIGAGVLGVPGLALGSGAGFLVDTLSARTQLYQFKVKPDHAEKTLTIIQYSSPLPVHSRVRILEKNGTVFIKKLE